MGNVKADYFQDINTDIKIGWKSAAPTTGSWANGDIVFNTAPTTTGFIGWVCTTAGSPGTWRGFGDVVALPDDPTIPAWAYTVKTINTDTTPNYLASKLVAGSGIDLTTNSPTGNSTITIALETTLDSLMAMLNPNGSQSFTSSSTFTVPAGVNVLFVIAQGAGGGGGGGANGHSIAGGGGGSGVCAARLIYVTPGQSIPVTIGTGGTAGTVGAPGANGGTGGTTYFGSTSSPLLKALGGFGGISTTYNQPLASNANARPGTIYTGAPERQWYEDSEGNDGGPRYCYGVDKQYTDPITYNVAEMDTSYNLMSSDYPGQTSLFGWPIPSTPTNAAGGSQATIHTSLTCYYPGFRGGHGGFTISWPGAPYSSAMSLPGGSGAGSIFAAGGRGGYVGSGSDYYAGANGGAGAGGGGGINLDGTTSASRNGGTGGAGRVEVYWRTA